MTTAEFARRGGCLPQVSLRPGRDRRDVLGDVVRHAHKRPESRTGSQRNDLEADALRGRSEPGDVGDLRVGELEAAIGVQDRGQRIFAFPDERIGSGRLKRVSTAIAPMCSSTMHAPVPAPRMPHPDRRRARSGEKRDRPGCRVARWSRRKASMHSPPGSPSPMSRSYARGHGCGAGCGDPSCASRRRAESRRVVRMNRVYA